MYCNKCGNQLNDNVKFCQRCGNAVSQLNQNPSNLNQSSTNNSAQPSYTEQQTNNSAQPSYTEQQTNNSTVQPGYNQQPTNNSAQPSYTGQPTNNSAQPSYTGQQTNFSNNNQNNNSSQKTSKIIGIISIILVFMFQIFVIPLAIVGLVFGLKARKINKKINIGIILNLITIIIAVPLLLLYASMFKNMDTTKNYNDQVKGHFLGTWNCASPTSPDDYTFVVKLDKNNKYLAGQYGDLNNDYASGQYEFQINDKTMSSMADYNLFWFYLEFINTDEYISNGIEQNKDYNAKFEVGRFVGKDYTDKYITLASTNGNNTYICEKEL